MRLMGWAELCDRPSGDRDRELLAGFGAPQDLGDVVAQLFLGDDGGQKSRVAVLLPSSFFAEWAG